MSTPARATRVAVIGAGAIAQDAHLPALRALGDRVEIVAVIDIDAERAARVADDWGVPVHGTDVDAVLHRVHPDVAIIGTPPIAHRETAIACLDAGAWVLCEKPPTLSLAEYDEVATHEKPEGPYISYVFQHRFGSAAERLRDHVESGELGRAMIGICHTLWFRDAEYYDVAWRGEWATEGGGPSMGHGIHQMDLLLTTLGQWREVTAVMSTLERSVRTEDVSFAIVRFESGAVVSIVNSVLSPRETSYLRFDFSDATVEVEHLYGYDDSDWRWTPAAHVVDADRIRSWHPTENRPSSHLPQFRSFLDSFSARHRPRASGEDGRQALGLIAAMYKSALTGSTVRYGEIDSGDPFYTAMYGADASLATETLRRPVDC